MDEPYRERERDRDRGRERDEGIHRERDMGRERGSVNHPYGERDPNMLGPENDAAGSRFMEFFSPAPGTIASLPRRAESIMVRG